MKNVKFFQLIILHFALFILHFALILFLSLRIYGLKFTSETHRNCGLGYVR